MTKKQIQGVLLAAGIVFLLEVVFIVFVTCCQTTSSLPSTETEMALSLPPDAPIPLETRIISDPPAVESTNPGTWVKFLEGPGYGAFFDVELSGDGNALAVGATNHLHVPPYSGDVLIVKITLEGDLLWERTWGGNGYEQAIGVTSAEDGGYFIFGETDSYGSGDRDFFLLKTNAEGEEEWYKTYGLENREWPYGIIPLTDENLLLYGFTESPGDGGRNQYAVCVASDGQVRWVYSSNALEEDFILDALETPEGDLILAVGVAQDGMLVKLDSYGQPIWEKRYQLAGWQYGSQVVQYDDGGFLLAGFAMSSIGLADIWIAKTTYTGDLEWERSFGDPNHDDYINSLVQRKDGTYLFGGISNGVLLGLLDGNGDLIWSRSLLNQRVYGSQAIVDLDSGGFLIAGFIQITGGRSYDAILLRTDSLGQLED